MSAITEVGGQKVFKTVIERADYIGDLITHSAATQATNCQACSDFNTTIILFFDVFAVSFR